MNPTRILAILLIAGGAAGLLYGSFSYTKDTTALKIAAFVMYLSEYS